MKRFASFFAKRPLFVFRFAGVIGVLLGWATMYFFEDWRHPLFWLFISIAVVLGYGGAWGGLAEQWGWKPLRNDPLDWRKAKESYKVDVASEQEKNEDS